MSDFFRVQLAIVSRAAGHSATKRSAYQACAVAVDHVGRRYDFSRKAAEHAMPSIVLAPDDAPDWCRDPGTLWNRAAAAEKRIDAQEARIIDFSLPRAIPRHLWPSVVGHVYEPFRAAGMVLQVDVHDIPASDGERNGNVHAIATLRRLDGNDFARKKERAWNDWFRERDGRVIRELIAERLTMFCATHGIDYRADARPNADRDLPSPEVQLPRWNALAEKRTGTPTPAVTGLRQHRRRRQAWRAANAELAEAEAERTALERSARDVLARWIEPTDGAMARRARGDWRAATLRAWQGGDWLDADALGNIAKVRLDEERRCLWIDLTDGSTLIDTGDVIRLRGPVTWNAAEETAAAAERHGWTQVRVHGDQAYKDAVTVACALRGIPVVNHILSPEAEALLKSKLRARIVAAGPSPVTFASDTPGGSQAAYLGLLKRKRQGAPAEGRPEHDSPAPGLDYRPQLVGGRRKPV